MKYLTHIYSAAHNVPTQIHKEASIKTE